ncbi:MAG: Na+/H+ antiporter subunit E [Flavobacteriaceae bacterium CG_4_8_14_3_um_filter_34_10]|nr:Na+/H+ antiporter subunit E [Flavobacteriia bacterium]OIP51327.1 MAG: Na+/H+ antiporter subunit E [Flavobacteriaceae bacterium CG2_30_34_30]PIQ17855.1 MAG: Na+/H+ antiporter subunit E [Flavobacteriaceae bacterium CG18_big_fil_WC_8_21_14_2_50_34_36]PIV51258.1 MAG: Na+/H+ antiporter subunit E [Flavobacteriaceae bacterium CG02_land_8_20_14_3_00_34_13]PIX08382.1 MAG: Na+/H+ antiporter subunit E [Flavobacteriaceae bacterium CG_4_8_14_3_um_filter_34_10]PIZ07496.1 MAG: Na+/H+ antiporter subunit E 
MKSRFLSNILLTFVWVALTGGFEFLNFFFGFVVSFLILWVITVGSGEAKYFIIMPKIIAFLFFFLYELIKANIQVAYDVVTPTFYMTPGIVRVPLNAETNMEITLLANLISLTPGTLSLDVSDDKKVLYVHSMYISDKEKFIDGIKNGFEKRLLEILR